MTFNEAVEIIKEYTDCGGALLDGLEQVDKEIRDEDYFCTPQNVKVAYRFICVKMRPLFV